MLDTGICCKHLSDPGVYLVMRLGGRVKPDLECTGTGKFIQEIVFRVKHNQDSGPFQHTAPIA